MTEPPPPPPPPPGPRYSSFIPKWARNADLSNEPELYWHGQALDNTEDIMTEPKLLPCPFAKCGDKGELIGYGDDDGWRVWCPTCGARSGWYDTKAEAIVDWNDRTPTPPVWQPIETAPKDGTKIIMRSISYNIHEQEIVRVMDNYWTNDGWRCQDPNYRFTHWMPFLEPESK